MKVYLDDMRITPEGWSKCVSAEMAIFLLKQGFVKEISLDHDLGAGVKTGYDVAKWIEKEVITNSFIAPKIYVHSANPVGRKNIENCIKSIQKYREN